MICKKTWQDALKPFSVKSNWIATRQIIVTAALFVGVWVLYVKTLALSPWLAIPFAVVMAFFVLRFFVLMHDCGHGALFRSARANQIAGFVLGVLTGMPQFVWSKHHAYHHATNGDWEKYGGPLSIVTSTHYHSLSVFQRWQYRLLRHPLSFVFIGGFLYVLFNPRFNWLMGIVKLAYQVLITFFRSPARAVELLKTVPSKKWKSPKEFYHMTYNNVVLLAGWYLMSLWIGAYNFFVVYVMALSLAGGIGILFFTVQHNFENSYAVGTAEANSLRAALEGTSYLKLPILLNWFTADIGYHHIHHLSTAIPNYRLVACHNALKAEFAHVKRIRMSEISHNLKYLLWDTEKKTIVAL